MASTLRRITGTPPAVSPGAVVGACLTAPAQGDAPRVEGGLRLRQQYKAHDVEMPLVSIITVCLNASRTLEKAIDSVLAQTYGNLEYIVVDGQSTDATLPLLEKHGGAIDYFVSEKDAGLYHAMNKGLALASGQYVLILNADDWYEPTCVAELVEARRYSGRDMVSALAHYVDDHGGSVQVLRPMPFDASMRLRMPLRHETMLIPAEVYRQHGGYDTRFRIIADYVLTLKLFEAGVSHYQVPRPLLFFRNTGVSNTSHERLKNERRELIGAQFPFLSPEEVAVLEDLKGLRAGMLQQLMDAHPGQASLADALEAYHRDSLRPNGPRHWAGTRLPWAEVSKRLGRPMVSVILPIYKAQATLGAAIDSVLTQTLQDLELICVNDASPDDSLALTERYCRQDPRVISLVNEVNVGLGTSRNRGIRAARGRYVFHVDPDDTLPPDALEALVRLATEHDCDLVRGAYLKTQLIHRKSAGRPVQVSPLRPGIEAGVNTTLARSPALLNHTEGHWACLYRRDLALAVPYPTDLSMGQDSIFLVNAYIAARAVRVTGDLVYTYQANPDSAMNTFSLRKFRDALEWRRRAWRVLDDAGLRGVGDHLLFNYWSEDFFRALGAKATPDELAAFVAGLGLALRQASPGPRERRAPEWLQQLFRLVETGQEAQACRQIAAAAQADAASQGEAAKAQPPTPATTPPALATPATPARQPAAARVPARTRLKIATFCSMDHGGAGTGTQRRVAALRELGQEVSIHSLVVKSRHGYVKRVVPRLKGVNTADQNAVWQEVRKRAVLPAKEIEGFRAQELFSSPESVVDFAQIKETLQASDVVHLHWVVGMFDYAQAGQYLGDKPVVWTLADMNAFTGGCHYSEGCEGYKQECRNCPLLGGNSDLAHRNWKRKKAAYSQLKNLHIVCPSKWMAQRVKASSLLGDRPVHYIPNAFPVHKFKPTNRMVARIQLGLPLDAKLLLFGADSLTSKRKGGDHLRSAISSLIDGHRGARVEVVLFGSHSIQLPVPVHSLGNISEEERLALVYSAADAFVFPSVEDNAPLTVGEALLCGLPVVAFPVGNVTDLVRHGKTGYIAEYLDADDLAKGIRWALDASLRESISRSLECRISAAEVHDPRTAAQRHLELYRKVVAHDA